MSLTSAVLWVPRGQSSSWASCGDLIRRLGESSSPPSDEIDWWNWRSCSAGLHFLSAQDKRLHGFMLDAARASRLLSSPATLRRRRN